MLKKIPDQVLANVVRHLLLIVRVHQALQNLRGFGLRLGQSDRYVYEALDNLKPEIQAARTALRVFRVAAAQHNIEPTPVLRFVLGWLRSNQPAIAQKTEIEIARLLKAIPVDQPMA